MMLIACPFCGPRPESEFHFGGDFGNLRPEGFQTVGDDEWAAYLYMKKNLKGPVAEIWKHLTCQEVFEMRRDTLTHAVSETRAQIAGDGA